MSYAPDYVRGFSFTNHSTTKPTTPQPGVNLDGEYDGAGNSINAINANLQKIQRDDDKLQNGIVDPETFSERAHNLVGRGWWPRGEWAPVTEYRIADYVTTSTGGLGYVCIVDHTSSPSFAGDLSLGYWVLVTRGATGGTYPGSSILAGNGLREQSTDVIEVGAGLGIVANPDTTQIDTTVVPQLNALTNVFTGTEISINPALASNPAFVTLRSVDNVPGVAMYCGQSPVNTRVMTMQTRGNDAGTHSEWELYSLSGGEAPGDTAIVDQTITAQFGGGVRIGGSTTGGTPTLSGHLNATALYEQGMLLSAKYQLVGTGVQSPLTDPLRTGAQPVLVTQDGGGTSIVGRVQGNDAFDSLDIVGTNEFPGAATPSTPNRELYMGGGPAVSLQAWGTDGSGDGSSPATVILGNLGSGDLQIATENGDVTLTAKQGSATSAVSIRDMTVNGRPFNTYDVAMAFVRGAEPDVAGNIMVQAIIRRHVVPQNLTGLAAILSTSGHSADIVFELFAQRDAWGGTPLRMCTITIPLLGLTGVVTNLHPDIVAGELVMDPGNVYYLRAAGGFTTPMPANSTVGVTVPGLIK